MSEESLTKLVTELDKEIGKAKSLTSVDRELLSNLRRDIDDALARSQRQALSRDHAVLGELRTATERFESSHPDLAAAMAQIVDLFTKLGI
jgi:uncharacterized protein DUF4404